MKCAKLITKSTELSLDFNNSIALMFYFDFAFFGEKDIECLDVPMNNIVLVEKINCFNQIKAKIPYFLLSELFLLLTAVA